MSQSAPVGSQTQALDPLRHLRGGEHARGAFGDDLFGKDVNTKLTEQVHKLALEIHRTTCAP